jgi:uncharacterized protein (TIGR02646 family)
LPSSAASYLGSVTSRIVNAQDPKASAELSWRNRSRQRFAEVRATLDAMCSGVQRCMYCEDSAWTDVDHFRPRAKSPKLAFEWTNYLAACSGCNSNYKRSEFPVDDAGNRLLLNPIDDDPRLHLEFSPTTGLYSAVPGSNLATESIRVFGLNREILAKGRVVAWDVLQLAIVAYDQALSQGDKDQALRYRSAVLCQPFAGVLEALIKSVLAGNAIRVSAECEQAIKSRHEIHDWPHALFG